MKIIDRIEAYIKAKGISYNAFDKAIGASNGYIGKQIKNSASVGTDMVEKIICIFPDLNIEWLILGEGPMLKDQDISLVKSSRIKQEINILEESLEAYKITVETQRKYIFNLESKIEELKLKAELVNKNEQKRKVS